MADDFQYDQLDAVAKTCRLSSVSVSSYTTKVTIPAYYKDRENVTYTVTAIKEGLFNSGETKVTEVVIPATVTVIGHAGEGFAADDQYTSNFTECPNLETITVKEGNPVFESNGGVLYATVEGQKVLLNVPEKVAVSNTGAFTVPTGTARIARDAFAECSTVKSITFPADVEIDSNGGLCRLSWTTSYWVTGSGPLSVVDGMLVKTDGDQRDIISYPRYAYPPNSNNILTIKADYRTILPYAFANCDHIDRVIFNGTVKNIGEYAFARSNVRSITMPAGVNYLGGHTFEQCILLRSMSVKGSDVELPEYFAYGSGLESVTGDIKKLGDYAFARCPSLEEFPLTTTVELGEGAFSSSFKGQKVVFDYAEGEQALTPGKRVFSGSMLTWLDLSAFVTTPDTPLQLSADYIHHAYNLSLIEFPDFVTLPTDGYLDYQDNGAHRTLYLHSFSNPSGKGQLWYDTKGGAYHCTLYIAVTELADRFGPEQVTWPLATLFDIKEGSNFLADVYVDAYTPDENYLLPNTTYHVPGGAAKNYQAAVDNGCEVTELYGISFSNYNGKLRVSVDAPEAYSFTDFRVAFDDGEPTAQITDAISERDFDKVEKVRVTYNRNDFAMATDYPASAWRSSAIESVEADATVADDAAAEYFTVTGQKVANPEHGFYIKRTATGATKVAL